MFKKVCLVFLGLLLMWPVHSGAEDAKPSEQETTRMEEMVVTAGRVKEMRKEVTANITVIDEQQIRLSTARDLGELMAEENIGFINKYPGTLTSIGIRGFRTASHGNDLAGKVLILINGRRAGTGNSAKIMTQNIERVEIIRGPASVQYGSAAIGGVINVITKQGKGKPSFSVQGDLGSFGYEETAASFSGSAKGFDFSGSASRSSMDSYDTADGDKYHNTGYDEKVSGSLNLGYEFLPKNRIGVIGNYFDADKVGSPSYLSQNDKDDYTDKSTESLDIIYDGATQNDLFLWKARYFFGEDKAKWYDPTGSNPDGWDDGGPPSERTTDQKGAQAQFTWNPEHYELTTGIDWVNYEIENTRAPKKTEYDNPSYFLLGKARYLEDSLIFTGGARYDEYEVDMKEWGDKQDDDHISPKLGIAYLPIENIKLRANYAQGFKMPNARELSANFVSGFTQFVGNPDLDPEKSKTYEGGIDMYYKAFDASLSYFYTDFEDKIEQVTGAGGVQTWKNVGEAKVSGFEGEFSYDLASIWNWNWQIKPYLNFTYLTDYKDEETGEDLLYTSELNLSYGLTVSNFDGFSSRLNFSYVGKQDIQDWESGFPAPVIEKGGFTVADFSIEKRILNFNTYGDLTLRGEINNLFNKQYAYAKGFPMPGRNFTLGLRYEF